MSQSMVTVTETQTANPTIRFGDIGGAPVSSAGAAPLADDESSLPRAFRRNAARFATRVAYREKEFGIWQSWTWAEAHEQVLDLAAGFLDMGVEVGDAIAIAGRNRPAFYWTMVAAQYVGAIPVPVYQDSVADEIAYVIDNCAARFAVVGDQEQVDKLLSVSEQTPALEQIVYVDPRGLRKYDHTRLHEFSALQQRGRERRAELDSELQRRVALAGNDDASIILYTSGTTGRPKGVVLSNSSVMITARNTCEFDGLTENENILAYLPMAWVGDFVFSMAQACWAGFCVNCPESAETMQHDLQEIGATYFFAPPRFFESLLTTVQIRMEDASRVKRALYRWAVEHAKLTGPALLEGRDVSLMDRLRYRVGHAMIYAPLLNATGLSKVRVGYTAGEAIGPELFVFYRSLGINLKQLYGQTEACVFLTQQPDGEVYSDTVGVPTPGVEVRIADSGEVFYRSPGTFREYFGNPESTAETKDAEGWVATGDAGFFDSKTGHLRIIDRAKDVGKLANGNMFAPKFVENKLKFYSDILEVVVIGRDREYCTALVNIDLKAVGNWAERNNIAYASYQELAAHPQVYNSIKEHVEAVNQSVAEDERLFDCQVHRFLVLHKELDPDDGEITRTGKVRRRIVEERYAPLYEALYNGAEEVFIETSVTYEDGRTGLISANLRVCNATVVKR
jgi:long-chain acyl-CoA synthetase